MTNPNPTASADMVHICPVCGLYFRDERGLTEHEKLVHTARSKAEPASRQPASGIEAQPVAWLVRYADPVEFSVHANREMALDYADGISSRIHPLYTADALPSPPVQPEQVVALREVLADAAKELGEAQDKFWVFHCNAPTGDYLRPGSLTDRHLKEDKAFLAELSDRMGNAEKRARAALANLPPQPDERAQIVAWLRASTFNSGSAHYFADAIERGDHLHPSQEPQDEEKKA